MTSVRKRARTLTGAELTNIPLGVDDGTGTYATWVSSSRNATMVCTFSNFGWPEIPPGTVIDKITAHLRHYQSSITDINYIDVGAVSLPLQTTPNEFSQVLAGTTLPQSFDVNARRGNNNRQTTAYFDYLDVTVEYTEPAGSEFMAWNGSLWVPGKLKKWTGSAWQGTTAKRWNGATWEDVP
jgi:hypothetical protein